MEYFKNALPDQPGWKILYTSAAIGALLMVLFIPVQGAVFAFWPPPETVSGWFALFQEHPFIGLMDMDLLLIVDYIIFLLIFLAIWFNLRSVNPALVTMALLFQVVSIATYFASTVAFEMLGLSHQYAVATTALEKTICLASGQVMLSVWQGTAFNISYLLGCLALILLSIAMLRSNVFSKVTAYLGLIAGLLMTVPPTVGMIGIIISFLSLVPIIPWLILIARKFFQLSHAKQV